MTKGISRGAMACPRCGSHLHVLRTMTFPLNGVPATKRYRRCFDCGLSVPTIEVILESKALRRSVERLQKANQERVTKAIVDLIGGVS